MSGVWTKKVGVTSDRDKNKRFIKKTRLIATNRGITWRMREHQPSRRYVIEPNKELLLDIIQWRIWGRTAAFCRVLLKTSNFRKNFDVLSSTYIIILKYSTKEEERIAPTSHGRRRLATIPLFPQHEGPSLRPQVTQVKMTKYYQLKHYPSNCWELLSAFQARHQDVERRRPTMIQTTKYSKIKQVRIEYIEIRK